MLSNNQIKLINSLHSKKGRNDYNLFLVEGEKGINELVNSTCKIEFIVLSENVKISINNFGKIPVYFETVTNVIKYSSLITNEFGFAVVQSQVYDENDFTFNNGHTLVLDGIRDPGNLGTIIRICDWYGIKQIVCSTDTTEFYNPKVISASMGSFHRIKFIYKDLPSFLKQFIDIPKIGATLDGDNVHEFDFPKNAFIIFGNESEGIRASSIKLLSKKLKIPSWGQAESLNVAIAAGIVLDNLRRSS